MGRACRRRGDGGKGGGADNRTRPRRRRREGAEPTSRQATRDDREETRFSEILHRERLGRPQRGGEDPRRSATQAEEAGGGEVPGGDPVGGGRPSAQPGGRRRVQARRPRPDLPQVHLRRLRKRRAVLEAAVDDPDSRLLHAHRRGHSESILEDRDEYTVRGRLLGARGPPLGRPAQGRPSSPTSAHASTRRWTRSRRRTRRLRGVLPEDLRPPRTRPQPRSAG